MRVADEDVGLTAFVGWGGSVHGGPVMFDYVAMVYQFAKGGAMRGK